VCVCLCMLLQFMLSNMLLLLLSFSDALLFFIADKVRASRLICNVCFQSLWHRRMIKTKKLVVRRNRCRTSVGRRLVWRDILLSRHWDQDVLDMLQRQRRFFVTSFI
jgi:hypothetical protein